MKRLFLTVLALTLVARLVVAQEAISVNAVGYARKTVVSNNLWTLCSVNFEHMGSNTIQEVFSNELTGSTTVGSSDMIYKFDGASQEYQRAWKVEGAGAPYEYLNGKWVWDDGAFPPNVISNMTFELGEAFWVRNRQSSNQTLTVVGEVPVTNTGVLLVEGMNLFSYPYSCNINLNNPTNDLTKVAKGSTTVGSSDLVYEWDEATQRYIRYWLVEGAGAPYEYLNGQWVLDDGAFPPNIASNALLGIAYGYWFRNRQGSNVVWQPDAPYSL